MGLGLRFCWLARWVDRRARGVCCLFRGERQDIPLPGAMAARQRCQRAADASLRSLTYVPDVHAVFAAAASPTKMRRRSSMAGIVSYCFFTISDTAPGTARSQNSGRLSTAFCRHVSSARQDTSTRQRHVATTPPHPSAALLRSSACSRQTDDTDVQENRPPISLSHMHPTQQYPLLASILIPNNEPPTPRLPGRPHGADDRWATTHGDWVSRTTARRE